MFLVLLSDMRDDYYYYLDDHGIPRRTLVVPALPAEALAAVSSGRHLAVVTFTPAAAATTGGRRRRMVMAGLLRSAAVLLLKVGSEVVCG